MNGALRYSPSVQPILGVYWSILISYAKCSKILNTLLILAPYKMLMIGPEIHKMLIRIANREDPDQTASSEAV